MDEQRVGAKSLGDEVDRLSNLPESLLLEILLNLPTNDVVKCSVLSSRWRNLWRFVPGLDLDYLDFLESDAFVNFVDKFLSFNEESCIRNFKLCFYGNMYDRTDIAHFTQWIDNVVERKVQHLHVSDHRCMEKGGQLQIPLTVFTCKSLVSLYLRNVILASPEFISFPCVKVINLDRVWFANDLAFEMLISCCPVLESLTFHRNRLDKAQVLRVRSKSLLRFEYWNIYRDVDPLDREGTIDAPRLEYLKFNDLETGSFIINKSPSLVKVDINIGSRVKSKGPQKRNMIHNFLVAISSAKDMKITSSTLQIIYDYSRHEPLPLFPNLSSLKIRDHNYKWEMLLIFLGSCPNLESLVMDSPKNGLGSLPLPRPQCLLSSLEFVQIDRTEMKVASYFLENSTILKKLTLYLKNYKREIHKKLLSIPRLSSSCRVVVLSSFYSVNV